MKKLCSILLILCLLLQTGSVLAYDEESANASQILYSLGLLKGNTSYFSAESMELDRWATRAEIAITITRMLGKDQKALYQQNAHPFSDVPTWAGPYIGWLYENYLVNGVSDTYFGAYDIATVQQFSAMMLRVLGYSDTEGDFYYNDASQFAYNIGLINDEMLYRYELLRSDMVKICMRALQLPIKNSNRLLAKKLCDEKVFSKDIAASVGLNVVPNALDSYFANVELTMPDIVAENTGNGIRLFIADYYVEEYGIRIFFTSKSHPTVTEIPLNGYGLGFNKGQIHYLDGGAAGYIDELNIYGLYDTTDLQLIVIKTSSAGEYYDIYGKSNIMTLY